MNSKKIQKGFALLMAVIITSTLLLISYALSNISLKELTLSYAGKDSQVAFYAADAGVECALYWDIRNPDTGPGASAFDPNISNNNGAGIWCNGNFIQTTSSVSDDPHVPTVPNPSKFLIGGGLVSGENTSTSTFYMKIDPTGTHQDVTDYTPPCAIVRVGKRNDTVDPAKVITIIESRGYNTCDINNARRLERALRVVY